MPLAQNGEIRELKKLILNIHTQSKKEWDRIQDSKKIQKMENLQLILFQNITISHLKKILDENPLKLQKKYRIFLPPLDDEQDFLPLFTFECNYSAKKYSYKFCLDLVKENPKNPKILSLRFEIEKSNGTTGDHDYLHVQINNRIDDLNDTYELDWLPDHHPHLLIHSENNKNSPVVLIIYLLGCLYGFKTFTKNVLGGIHPSFINDFKEYYE